MFFKIMLSITVEWYGAIIYYIEYYIYAVNEKISYVMIELLLYNKWSDD